MTEAPKRLWHAIDDFGRVSTDIDAHVKPDGSIAAALQEYHRADLSADLVRAGYRAGVMDVQKIASDAEVFDVSDEAEYLAADPEAVAAIVAQVMENENE